MELRVCVLAAGQGKRMNSDLPKVMHALAGKPMIEHVLDTAEKVTTSPPVIVYGHGGEVLRAHLTSRVLVWAEQREQLGTGHAVAQALPALPPECLILILYGDVPLLSADTLKLLVAAAKDSGFGLLTVNLADPTGYGRVTRDTRGEISAIVEHRDADSAVRAINEVNTGVMALRAEYLHRWIPKLETHNAQGEYYLTDCVEMAVTEGIRVASVMAASEAEVLGVNTRNQLAYLERIHQRGIADALMVQGVTLLDPSRVDIRGNLRCGRDVVIDINALFEGNVELADGVYIGPNCVIRDSTLGVSTRVLANCVIEEAHIGENGRIGPFSRVRPETDLGQDVHIGNFVEVKKSTIADGSKVNHLAYIGDAAIGRNVNVGAGTITCNYDGAYKHKTIIEDDAFIGSDTQLVAPVTVGRGATVGAGTTVTEDVEPGRLVISRVRQKTIAGYQRPRKEK
jgi:bifunctional UDP-N-acetylglucosamine pyrophosphorylase/glucosamine-1-phosphate N-acetyltransferase